MTRKLEEIARAIRKADEEWFLANFPDATEEHMARLSEGLEDNFRAVALAAVRAMREPTEEMLEASNREWDGRMSYRSSGAWQAVIDSILADTGERK